MQFTHSWYRNIIELAKKQGYSFCDYSNYNRNKQEIILRHDVDFSLKKAVEMAQIESELGISSTYFILMFTNFYNIGGKKERNLIKELSALGHNVGLHFDDTVYCSETDRRSFDYSKAITQEAKILSDIIGKPVRFMSMHRPDKVTLDMNINLGSIINAYDKVFFSYDIKYVSDSRRHWREDLDEIIKNKSFDKIQMLVHPFWYCEKEMSAADSLRQLIKESTSDRFMAIKDNITRVEEFLNENDYL
ncbi:MAG: hypothetical protein SPI74_01705 [Eubacterium sp.]|nr:hypothetical protein [Eubacterium sp.]